MVTGILIAGYWPTHEWAWRIAGECNERGFPWCVIAAIVMGLWLCGVIICAAPPVAMVAAAICA